MRVENCVGSNLVMVAMPLWPASRDRQLASVPMPSDDTKPIPVTTTRRLSAMKCPVPGEGLLFCFGVRLDVVDRFLDARDLLGLLVGNFDAEFLLEGHDELDGVERVGAQIVHERSVRRHFFLIDAELLHDDALDFVRYGHSILLQSYMYIPPLTARTC